jgi:hypothetical protein
MKTQTNRRHFLRTATASCVAIGLYQSPLRGQAAADASLRMGSAAGALVPEGFVGLSYENMQLEDASFFSPKNTSLVQQFRAIAPRGVLRLGGNTSEFSWWKATPGMAAPQRRASPWKDAGEPATETVFAITPEAIDNLDGFLKATGWSCIYGLNLGYGSPELDLPEAVYVHDRLGPRLQYFQVGNEVDLFSRHLRDEKTWNVDRYLEEWLKVARAVQTRLPGARFGMPDVASDVTWLEKIAERWPAVPDKPSVTCLSHHYYWSGPPSNPEANVANLLKPDPRVAADAQLAKAAAQHMGAGLQWRMTEGNTVYRGGKDGVSDVFASALWSADYLLQMMCLGYAGVNLHGGSGHAQAVSVGGVFHGEALMADPTVPHPKPFYTPIANEGTLAGAGVNGILNSTYVLEPVAYGMKFAAAFAGSTMLNAELTGSNVNATAYAARSASGITLIAVINKDASRPLQLTLPPIRKITTLSAESLESRSAQLNSRQPTPSEARGKVEVPAHTALLLIAG